MAKVLKLARRLPWPLPIILTAMTSGGVTAVDPKPKSKSRTDG